MTSLGLWLVRHGASTAPAGVAIGSSDPPLSLAGRLQAVILGVELANRPLTAVYSSDMLRAINTAKKIGAAHKLPVQIDSRLRELDFGAWEGRRLADLWIEEPEAASAWERDLGATPLSFAEDVAQMEARVAAFWQDASAPARGALAVVAHRGSLAVLQALATGAPVDSIFAAGFELGTAVWINVPHRIRRPAS